MRRWIWQHLSWPHFTWDEATVFSALARTRLAQGRALGALGVLDNQLELEAEFSVLVEDSLKTSAVEGERLNPGAVRSSVARQLGIPWSAPTPAPRAVEGLVELLVDATRHHNKPLTLKRLLGWQAALFPTGYSGLIKIRVGKLRGPAPMRVVSGAVGRETLHFEAPPRDRLSAELHAFLRWFAEKNSTDGLVRAGLAHLWFVTIHPFEDGNGRIARAIGDMALAQDEQRTSRAFSVSAQIAKARDAYYNTLEHTQRGDLDVTEWLVWFLTQVETAARTSQTIVAHTLAKARFWLRYQQQSMNDRQRKVLNRLLDSGPSQFEGGMTTRKYRHLTKTSRATAYRELSDLVEKGCLAPLKGAGRSSAYDLPWESLGVSVDSEP